MQYRPLSRLRQRPVRTATAPRPQIRCLARIQAESTTTADTRDHRCSADTLDASRRSDAPTGDEHHWGDPASTSPSCGRYCRQALRHLCVLYEGSICHAVNTKDVGIVADVTAARIGKQRAVHDGPLTRKGAAGSSATSPPMYC